MTRREDDVRDEEERQGPIIRDRRRIDPETGAVREPAGTPAPGATATAGDDGTGPADGPAATPEPEAETGAGPGDEAGAEAGPEPFGEADELAKLQNELGERVQDLQRLQAEYANYRKRVERDRVAVKEQALANVLSELLPVLDDIGRAREHDELTGGFKSVSESLEATVAKLGLQKYGEVGEPFDPAVHEALMHSFSDEVTEPTCVEIFQPGYTVGDRILRPARVVVAEPGEAPAAPEAAEQQAPADAAANGEQAEGGEPEAGPDDEGRRSSA
ncbi:MAG: nucleotide exchange factor GrpE [Streptosporangiales bacterium]|nr:nucleotide exchange factor GrpE [Streptosporangiales bacterium]